MAQRSPVRPASSTAESDQAGPTGHRSWLRDVALVLASVAIGLGAAWLLFGGDDAPEVAPPAADGADPTVDLDAPPATTTAPVEPGDGSGTATGAASPRAAATSFLAAEVDGDRAASHALLAPGDRERFDSVARWTAAHARFLPVTGFRLAEGDEDVTGDTATVRAEVRLASGLDPILGLVPARAELALVTVEQDGGWAVDWSASGFTARYPDEATAVPAARSWAESATDCGDRVEYDGGLFGLRSLVDDLCAADGPVELGAVGTLPADGGDRGLVSSFGADVVAWARVVPVTAPVAMDLVLAPVDEQWLVIGVLPRRS